MSRSLRVEFSGAVYHVINRGNRRDCVFSSDADYMLFMEKLVRFSELFEVVIYAYCLMPNHFHLHLKTRHANLSRFMQSFLTSFTLSLNKKYGKSGHLFQGRFNSQLVDGELYKNKLSRYIHLNPVKTKAVASKGLLERKRLLKDYRWSSYLSYIGLKEKPKWLDRQYVLKSWGASLEEQMKNYRSYVEQGLLSDNREELSQDSLHNIIGRDSFRKMVIRKYLTLKNGRLDAREQPELAKLKGVTFETVLDAVMSYYRIDNIDRILVRKQCDHAARRGAILLASEYCRRQLTLSQIATRFNLKISGLNTAKDKLSTKVLKDKALKRELQKIRNSIEKRKTEV